MNQYTYAEAAARLGCSVGYVRRMAQTGKIQSVSLGHRTKRIPEDGLKRFIERRTLRATVV